MEELVTLKRNEFVIVQKGSGGKPSNKPIPPKKNDGRMTIDDKKKEEQENKPLNEEGAEKVKSWEEIKQALDQINLRNKGMGEQSSQQSSEKGASGEKSEPAPGQEKGEQQKTDSKEGEGENPQSKPGDEEGQGKGKEPGEEELNNTGQGTGKLNLPEGTGQEPGEEEKDGAEGNTGKPTDKKGGKQKSGGIENLEAEKNEREKRERIKEHSAVVRILNNIKTVYLKNEEIMSADVKGKFKNKIDELEQVVSESEKNLI